MKNKIFLVKVVTVVKVLGIVSLILCLSTLRGYKFFSDYIFTFVMILLTFKYFSIKDKNDE